MEHSPEPLRLVTSKANEYSGCPVEAELRAGRHVVARLGQLGVGKHKANAERLALAWNMHDDLLHVARGLLVLAEAYSPERAAENTMIAEAKAVIAKAIGA